jgi:hypothetical protein
MPGFNRYVVDIILPHFYRDNFILTAFGLKPPVAFHIPAKCFLLTLEAEAYFGKENSGGSPGNFKLNTTILMIPLPRQNPVIEKHDLHSAYQ